LVAGRRRPPFAITRGEPTLPATSHQPTMFSPDDTIVAIATPPGRGGIGVVRISGEQAERIASRLLTRRSPLQPRYATFTRIVSDGTSANLPADERESTAVDEVVATFFPAPNSYTGQAVVEISAHGSPVVLEAIVRAALSAGARLARPGEFTLRAFLNGRRDLVQAEAVADLIDAATPLQARTAFDQLEGTLTRRIAGIDGELFDLVARLEASLDFPDEGYHFIEPRLIASRVDALIRDVARLLGDGSRGRMIREGALVAIAGRPNVGKSSLFNLLAGAERSIVTAIAGTTRDLITERVDIEGVPVTLVDTAGAREAQDVIEREGVMRGAHARKTASLVLLVLDCSEALTDDDERLLEQTAEIRRVIVANKADLPRLLHDARLETAIPVSAATGSGIDVLRGMIARALTGAEPSRDTAAISNTRHLELLAQAQRHLIAARDAAADGTTPEEFLLVDLQSARARFDEIVGTRTSEDVLIHIFERFCIGK
jgi:tRNA modification GTPase